MKSKQERILRREEKRFFKLLNGLAKCNPNVPFLFDDDKNIIADSKYVESNINREMTLDDLAFPSFRYYFNKYSNKIADVFAESLYENEPPVAVIEIDNSLKTMDESKYDGFYIYEVEESKVKKFFNNIKNKVKYFFSKRANAVEDYKNSTLVKKPVEVKKTLSDEEKTKNIEKAIKNITPLNNDTKTEDKTKEPVQKPVQKTVKDKKDEVIEKFYDYQTRKAYAELGEYERMFIDDAKAECLVPGDNEFNMMLNERAVNKDAILNYYSIVEENNKNKKLEYIKVDFDEAKKNLYEAYNNLGEYEKMFVDDALAENLDLNDNEFNMMMNERTINKNSVISFMKTYKNSLTEQKDLINKYAKVSNTEVKDYSVYSINDLRKEVSKNKSMLTKAELEKQKTSSLKKDELIEIMARIDSKNNETEIAKRLG